MYKYFILKFMRNCCHPTDFETCHQAIVLAKPQKQTICNNEITNQITLFTIKPSTTVKSSKWCQALRIPTRLVPYEGQGWSWGEESFRRLRDCRVQLRTCYRTDFRSPRSSHRSPWAAAEPAYLCEGVMYIRFIMFVTII